MYIICSMGPKISTAEEIRKLRIAGMTMARFNFSHSQYYKIERLIKILKKNNPEVKIMQDLQGNKLRVSKVFLGEKLVKKGEKVIFCLDDLYMNRNKHFNNTVIPINYIGDFKDILGAKEIFMKDATMHFKILRKYPKFILSEVLRGGVIRREKGLNFPGIDRTKLNTSKKDIKDIIWGLDKGVDIICASYVSKRKDVEDIKRIIRNNMKSGRKPPKVWAKIECREAIERFDEILEVSDGIVLGRGDLKAEIPLFEIPIIQEKILKKMKFSKKPLIIATHVLESLKKDFTPTIGELSDIYNSIKQGVNGFMLAGEVGTVDNPGYVVKTLNNIIKLYDK